MLEDIDDKTPRIFHTYPNTGGTIFCPEGDSLSGSGGRARTRGSDRDWLPSRGVCLWPAEPIPCSPGASIRVGLWRLFPKMEASSESLRPPPVECMDPWRTELQGGARHSFLQAVKRRVARMTARQREMPVTTIRFPPRTVAPAGTPGGEGEGAAVTGGHRRLSETEYYYTSKHCFVCLYGQDSRETQESGLTKRGNERMKLRTPGE